MKELVVGPNAITSKTTSPLSDIFSDENCEIVYLADGSYKSWKPGRLLNAFTDLEVDKGYLVVMKETLDVSDDVVIAPEAFIQITNYSGADAIFKVLNGSGTAVFTETIPTGSVHFFKKSEVLSHTGASQYSYQGTHFKYTQVQVTLAGLISGVSSQVNGTDNTPIAFNFDWDFSFAYILNDNR